MRTKANIEIHPECLRRFLLMPDEMEIVGVAYDSIQEVIIVRVSGTESIVGNTGRLRAVYSETRHQNGVVGIDAKWEAI